MQFCFGPCGGAVLSLSIEKEVRIAAKLICFCISVLGECSSATSGIIQIRGNKKINKNKQTKNKALTLPLHGGIYSPVGASVLIPDVPVSEELLHIHQYSFVVCLQSNCLYITRCRAVQSNAKNKKINKQNSTENR